MPPDTLSKNPSFVPHNEHRTRRHVHPGGPVVIISFLIFLISAGLATGAYFYTRFLETKLESKKIELAEAENSLDRSTAEELIRLSDRLRISSELLQNHIAVTPLYQELERVTLPSVQYTLFALDTEATPRIELEGEARSYASIALQSDSFGGNRYFKNPVFSAFEPTEDGRIRFKLTLDVDPSLFVFARTI